MRALIKAAWGEKVTPANARREYPRPQFVRDRWVNLNGLWDYAITPRTARASSKFEFIKVDPALLREMNATLTGEK